MGLLSEKVVLVTGATQGLGAGIARCAAQHGASVVVAGRDASRGEAAAAEIGGVFVAGDVGIPAQATGLVEATVARFGRIDGLVNSAGLTSRGTLLDTTPELFDEHIAVNLRGPFFTMQAAVADMTRRGAPGAIVNIITMGSSQNPMTCTDQETRASLGTAAKPPLAQVALLDAGRAAPTTLRVPTPQMR